MTSNFKTYMQQLSDEDLLKAFEEFQDCVDTGCLVLNGKAREIWNVFNQSYNTKFDLKQVEKQVFYEMAMIYYKLKLKISSACCQLCIHAVEYYIEDDHGNTLLIRTCENRNGAAVDDDDWCEEFTDFSS